MSYERFVFLRVFFRSRVVVFFSRIKKDEDQGKEKCHVKIYDEYVCLFAIGLKKARAKGKKMSH